MQRINGKSYQLATRARQSLSKACHALVISAAILGTAACTNLVDGDTLKTKISGQVAEATAASVPITIQPDATTSGGTTSPIGTSVSEKVGIGFNVTATPYSDYGFGGWTATGDGAVTFVDASAASTTATVTKSASNVVITGNFVARPTVLKTSPYINQTDVYISSPIRITFSKAIDPKTAIESNFSITKRLKDSTNDAVSIDSYFNAPTVSGSVVTLSLKSGKSLGDTDASYEIFVTVSKKVKDLAGNMMANSYPFSFTTSKSADNTAPTVGDITVKSAAGVALSGSNATNSCNVIVNFDAADNSGSMTTVITETTGGNTTTLYSDAYQGNIPVTLAAVEGASTLTVGVSDPSGNTTTKTATVTYDVTLPTASVDGAQIASSGANAGYAIPNGVVTIPVSVAEATSGMKAKPSVTLCDASGTTIASMSVADTASTGSPYVYNATYTMKATDEQGVLYYKVSGAQDNAGNTMPSIAATSTGLYFDSAPPAMGTVSLADASANSDYTIASATLKASATDTGYAGAGILKYEYQIDMGSWTDFTGTASSGQAIAFMSLGQGSHTANVRATDKAGNTASTTKSIIYDSGDPTMGTVSLVDASSTTGYTKGSATLKAAASDTGYTGAGIAKYEYQVDTGSWTDFTGTASSGKSIDFTSLGQGSHTVNVRATDLAGRSSTTAQAIIYDSADPSMGVVSLVDGSAMTGYTKGSATLKAAASDTGYTGAGIAKYEYQVDGTAEGSWTDFTGTASSGKSIDFTGLGQGSHTVNVRATDLAGRRVATAASVSIIYDSTDPTMGTVSLVDASSTTGYTKGSATLKAAASDTGYTGAGILKYEYQVDAGSLTDFTSVASSGLTVDFTSLTQGSHTVNVRVTDLAGRSSTTAQVIIYDSAAPTMDTVSLVDTSANGGYTKGSATLKAAASDTGYTGAGIAKYEYQVDTGSWTDFTGAASSGKSIDFTSLGQGSHTVNVRATDLAGRQVATAASASIIYDSTDPTMGTVSLVDGSATTGYTKGSATLKAAATDSGYTGAGILKYEYQVDTGSWTDFTGTASSGKSIDFTGLGQGSHTVNVRVTDLAGRSSTTAQVIIYDSADPTMGTVSLVDGSATTGYTKGSATLKAAATDSGYTGAGISKYEYQIDGTAEGSWTDFTGTASSGKSIDFTSLGQGSHTVNVRAMDLAGRSSTTAQAIIYDSADPTMGTVSLVDGSATTGYTKGSATLKAAATDSGYTGAGISKYEYQIDGTAEGSWTDFTGTASSGKAIDFTSLGQGSHTVNVRAMDLAGWSSTTAKSIIYDSADPTMGTVSLVDGSATTGYTKGSATLKAAATDSGYTGAGIAKYEYQIDGTTEGSWTDFTGTASSGKSIDFTGLGQGSHTVNVRVTDLAGRSGTTAQAIIYDSAAPTMDTVSLVDGSATTGYTKGSATLTAAATDSGYTGAGISKYEYQIDGTAEGSWTDFTGAASSGKSIDFTGLGQGSHTVNVRATDLAGRQVATAASASIIYDSADPTMGTVSLVDGSATTGYTKGSATLTAAATDSGYTGAGIEKYEYQIDGTAEGSWTDFTGTASSGKSIDFTGLGQGSHTVNVRVTDLAGRSSTTAQAIIYDSAVPTMDTVSLVDGSANSGYTKGSATLTAAATDSGYTGAGIEKYEYQIDGTAEGSWTDFTGTASSGKSIDFTGLGQGSHTVNVRVTDLAGRSSTTAKSIIYDSAAPTTNPDSGAAAPSFDGASKTLSIPVAADATGVTGVKWGTTPGSLSSTGVTVTTPVAAGSSGAVVATLPSNPQVNFYFQFCDGAGNWSLEKMVTCTDSSGSGTYTGAKNIAGAYSASKASTRSASAPIDLFSLIAGRAARANSASLVAQASGASAIDASYSPTSSASALTRQGRIPTSASTGSASDSSQAASSPSAALLAAMVKTLYAQPVQPSIAKAASASAVQTSSSAAATRTASQTSTQPVSQSARAAASTETSSRVGAAATTEASTATASVPTGLPQAPAPLGAVPKAPASKLPFAVVVTEGWREGAEEGEEGEEDKNSGK